MVSSPNSSHLASLVRSLLFPFCDSSVWFVEFWEQPQGDHIELHRKRHGYRLDHFERKRKKEAREVHKRSAYAQKVGLRYWLGVLGVVFPHCMPCDLRRIPISLMFSQILNRLWVSKEKCLPRSVMRRRHWWRKRKPPLHPLHIVDFFSNIGSLSGVFVYHLNSLYYLICVPFEDVTLNLVQLIMLELGSLSYIEPLKENIMGTIFWHWDPEHIILTWFCSWVHVWQCW